MMTSKSIFNILVLLILSLQLNAQGITTAELSGFVQDEKNNYLEATSVILEHIPSKTKYQTSTQSNGLFFFPNLKAGGPYHLKVSYLGFEEFQLNEIYLSLGKNNFDNIYLTKSTTQLSEVKVVASLIQNKPTGSETFIGQKELEFLPNIQRSILDFTSLNPQSNLAGFGGKGARDNFVSIDGSSFNNTYGIGGNSGLLIGNVVGAQPLSLDAIEAVQINISPFDVRQGGFTGAGIHAITKSGSNTFKGTAYSYFQNQNLVGKKIDNEKLPIPNFSQYTFGANLGGALIKNKLFFFVNFEKENRSNPATNFLANRSNLSGDNVTRVESSDLEELSSFLKSNYNYETGAFENYNHQTENEKLLLKLDWNISSNHHLSLRYNFLNGTQDFSPSNSGSFGAPNRVDNLFSMSFQNSGGIRKVNAKSFVGELKSFFGSKVSNKLLVSYSIFPDSREIKDDLFPTVDILQGGQNYISFGSHLFSTNNSIQQKTLQVQDDVSLFLGKHTLTFGASWEYFKFDYSFTPAAAGSFVFASLDDFYNSTPIGTSTPVGLSNGIGRPSIYSRTYTTLEANDNAEVNPILSQFGSYIQDEINLNNLKIIGGIRIDISSFPKSPLENSEISSLTFQDANGNAEAYQTNKLPNASILLSPRFGFHWNISEQSRFQVRGGTGIFTGRTPMARIGDQFVNNGLLQGKIKAQNNAANQYPFNPDPNSYIPEDRTAASTYDLNLTAQDYKMPQLWKSSLGLDFKISPTILASFDLLYSDEINRDFVRNVNVDHVDKGTSSDGRFVFNNSKLNNPPVLGAYVLENTSLGNQFHATFQLKKKYNKNWMASFGYTFGQVKDVNTFFASTARSAYRNLPVVGNSNLPVLSFSDDFQKHRVVLSSAYRINYGRVGATTISLFLEGAQRGRFSYTYSSNGDINKDGIPSNDLIFIPANISQIDLENYNQNGVSVSAEEQWTALENFINNSEYLSKNKGKFAERNGSAYPTFFQFDLRILQDLNFKISENKNTIQLSLDILNLANLFNSGLGVRKIVYNQKPIQARQNGKFRVDPSLLDNEFLNDNGLISRWQMRIGLRYNFN